MLVYDIVVNGEIKETIKPRKNRLKEIYSFMLEQSKLMKVKYGENVKIKGRMVY
ncbi:MULTISPECIES: mechanosensitive ion channel protein MscL [Paenibacillus]|uniref:Mechanosensitive ion channel protein MscL n=2 Tax=Paenibacillus TaxID=44249 RepID=A0A1V4HPY7_9BACL|nr:MULTISPECIES: mechanosensitive ion channel protein MscL [Paenibacillus]MEC0228785.1 mechanosensitive ion channel protein MscL [Paenibacillus alba]NQX69082.1 mechanosensitive ion channel protein MscL [Paenibacillus alba]OPH60343.1 mechanosensitive ion channel protein MscL [Paenibacillus ferrarius]